MCLDRAVSTANTPGLCIVESLDRQSRSKMPYAGLNRRLCILGIPTGLTYVNVLNSSSHLHVLPAFSSRRSRRRATLCRNHIIGHECRAVRRHHSARTCPSWLGPSSTGSLMCRCPLQPYGAALWVVTKLSPRGVRTLLLPACAPLAIDHMMKRWLPAGQRPVICHDKNA